MTNSEYFRLLSRRKSVRKFEGPLTDGELGELKVRCEKMQPLVDGLDTAWRIVPRRDTPARFGEHCLLFYSAAHPLDKVNAGYMLQQIDLWLEGHGFGCCWYGMAKPEEREYEGLEFVIMLTFGRGLDGGLRSGAEDFRRKAACEIWQGESDLGDIVRLAPSACNSQPWRFAESESKISVWRETDYRTIIPKAWRPLFNGVDLGISLFFLETALKERGRNFECRLITEPEPNGSLIPIAEYTLF